jgi:hypothetical protein
LSDTTDGRLRHWISTLSSDEFQGRAPGTEGGKLTKNFISKTFKDLDLEPVKGSYFLEVPTSEITLKDSSYLTLSFRGNDQKMIQVKKWFFGLNRPGNIEKLEIARLFLLVMESLLLNIIGMIMRVLMLGVKRWSS